MNFSLINEINRTRKLMGLYEGLNLVSKKKYREEIEGDYPNGYGTLIQYWDNGIEKFTHSTYDDGSWQKSTYDENGNEISYEDSAGFWAKSEYDENGNEIYYETSNGIIEDNRPQNINEGLNLPKKKYCEKIVGNYPDGYGSLIQYWNNGNEKFKHITFNDGSWYKRYYDENGYIIYYENSRGETYDKRLQNINEGLNLVSKKISKFVGLDRDLMVSLDEYGIVARILTPSNYNDEYHVIYKVGENQYNEENIRESDLDNIVVGNFWASNEDLSRFFNFIGIKSIKDWAKLDFIFKLYSLVNYFGVDTMFYGTGDSGFDLDTAIERINNHR